MRVPLHECMLSTWKGSFDRRVKSHMIDTLKNVERVNFQKTISVAIAPDTY